MICWCGMSIAEGRSHYPGNDPESGPAHKPDPERPECLRCGCPRHDGPCEYNEAICYFCGAHSDDPKAEGWTEGDVDADPGDPEVGPQPDVIHVDICPDCVDICPDCGAKHVYR